MRPRLRAAENHLAGPAGAELEEASMRPRLRAAENQRGLRRENPDTGRFNEAAAESRGKRLRVSPGLSPVIASMRPRLRAAENGANLADAYLADRLQ